MLEGTEETAKYTNFRKTYVITLFFSPLLKTNSFFLHSVFLLSPLSPDGANSFPQTKRRETANVFLLSPCCHLLSPNTVTLVKVGFFQWCVVLKL